MSSVTEPEASRPSSKRPFQPPDKKPSAAVLLQKTEALSTPAHKDKRVDNEDAARATKKAKTTEVIAELAQVNSPAAPEERNAASAEEPLDSGGPGVEPSVTQDIPDAVPSPAAGSGRTEVAEMIEQRSPVASAEDANASVIAKNSIEEELALVPMEAEAQAAQATMPAPVLPLVRQSRAPPEEETALQAPVEPDHAKLREEAIRTERERLAPERVREITKAYERLAARHAWPQLPGDGLPHELKSRVKWFFLVNADFQHALQAKKRAAASSAVTDKLARQREKCPRCQREKSLARDFFCRQKTAYAWDACAEHLALSVAQEVKIEEELASEWAEEAIYAWQRDMDLAANARRDSQARQQAEEAESKRRRKVERQAREQLRSETRRCEDCWEYDEVTGGMCPLHEEKHKSLCVAMGSGVSDKPMAAPLSARTPSLQC